MGCLFSLIAGAFIGWLAGLLTRSNLGLLGSIVIGIVGSALGHHLSDSIGLSAYGPVARLAVSVGGAVLLITILRFVGIM